ncbi:MAG TPA: inorganic phosphate transporter [Kofleriaceae bacterium]
MDAATIVWITVAVALIFDIINGFHDAANSIATIVSTRVLSPRYAVLWAATFNFVALFIFHTGVAKTISGIVEVQAEDPAFVYVVMCGLIGAIAWNLLTWWWGLPSSSSHALIGGLSGAGIAYAGPGVLNTAKLYPTLGFILVAPLIGLTLGMFMMIVVSWLFRKVRPRTVDSTFRIGQLISAGLYSIGHGGNDAQKTIGVIIAVMIAGGQLATDANHNLAEPIPTWVIFASYGCMAFGTAIGGWRIVKTMGMGLTHLKPVGGFCAEVAGAITLFGATFLKIPVSTTHTITSAIVGVGSVTKLRGIRWGLASRIVWAWVFTIPLSALVGAVCLAVARALGAW